MKELTIIFVSKEEKQFDSDLHWLIQAFEHGDEFASHVAVSFDYLTGYGPVILEALGEGVVLSDIAKYDHTPKQCRLSIELTDEQYDAVKKKAVEIAELKMAYSFKSVLLGGIADTCSRRLANFLAKILRADVDKQMDCSEVGSTLVKAAFGDKTLVGASSSLSQITPWKLYVMLLQDNIMGNIHITNAQFYRESVKEDK